MSNLSWGVSFIAHQNIPVTGNGVWQHCSKQCVRSKPPKLVWRVMSSAFSMKFVNVAKRLVPRKISNRYVGWKDKLKFEMPERFKGTVVEKWGTFWMNLGRDYQEVIRETANSIRERPKRALAMAWGFAAWWCCVKTNPDAQSFRDQLLSMSTEMSTLPASIRAKEARDHLVFLESCYNEGTIRRLNLGIASIMWVGNYDEAVGLYAAQCKYLEPKYLSFHRRIVDIGFLGRWWIIQKKMVDYDINPSEWDEKSDS